jgi:hypothetical protein
MSMSAKRLAARIALAMAITLPLSAHAVITINLQQVGANVVATGSGAVNVTALSVDGVSNSSQIWPVWFPESLLIIGTGQMSAWFGSITGPANFGTGTTQTYADSSTGDKIGIAANHDVYLPLGYVSGTPVSGTSTWDNSTFASLGVTTGTYTWNWGNGANADSLVLNIGAPVPEPASTALLLSGLLVVGARLRRQVGGIARN